MGVAPSAERGDDVQPGLCRIVQIVRFLGLDSEGVFELSGCGAGWFWKPYLLCKFMI